MLPQGLSCVSNGALPCAHPQADGPHLSSALPCLGCSPSLSSLTVFGCWARLAGHWARLAGHRARLARHWARLAWLLHPDLFSHSGGTCFQWDRGGGGRAGSEGQTEVPCSVVPSGTFPPPGLASLILGFTPHLCAHCPHFPGEPPVGA